MNAGIDSVTFKTPESEVTLTGEQWKRVEERFAPQQLSFDVGGELARPIGASIAITGSGEIRSQLYIDDDVTIQVIDAGGEIVATFDGAVVNVAFRKHEQTETQAAWVERIHKIKLGETQ